MVSFWFLQLVCSSIERGLGPSWKVGKCSWEVANSSSSHWSSKGPQWGASPTHTLLWRQVQRGCVQASCWICPSSRLFLVLSCKAPQWTMLSPGLQLIKEGSWITVTDSCFGKGLSLLTVPVLPYDVLQEWVLPYKVCGASIPKFLAFEREVEACRSFRNVNGATNV